MERLVPQRTLTSRTLMSQPEQFEVGVEVPMEVLLRHLLDRCELVDARVVDEDINRPEGAFRLDEQASDIAPLGEEPWR
jgi:hypothetical protein